MRRFVVVVFILILCSGFRFSNLFLPEEYKQVSFNKEDWDVGFNRCVMISDIQENIIQKYMSKDDVEALLGKPAIEGVGCIAYPSNGECFYSYMTPSFLPHYLRVCFSGDQVRSEPEFVVIKTKRNRVEPMCSVLSIEACNELKRKEGVSF